MQEQHTGVGRGLQGPASPPLRVFTRPLSATHSRAVRWWERGAWHGVLRDAGRQRKQGVRGRLGAFVRPCARRHMHGLKARGGTNRHPKTQRHEHPSWCQVRLQTYGLKPCVSERLRPLGRLRAHGLRVRRLYLLCARERGGEGDKHRETQRTRKHRE